MYLGIKKYFSFLHDLYGFYICDKSVFGSYYLFEWTNGIINISVLYDFREDDPMTITIFEADSFPWFGTKYTHELACTCKRGKPKVKYAADWLREAIQTGKIKITG